MMNVHRQWLDDFMKWFFNASPFWVDQREEVLNETEARELRTNRRSPGDRRRQPVSHDARGIAPRAERRSRGS